MNQSNVELLLQFLNTPLENSDGIFERFAVLPNAQYCCGDKSLERYVYIPGTRKDRVVLVAHADTIWDKNYVSFSPVNHKVIFEDGVFKSSHPKYIIGADDRAGCAMLWKLLESGHSILITDGEEKGKAGARYLKKSNRTLFKELNRHRFMIEFDWAGTNECLYNQVDNTKLFKNYIETRLGFVDGKATGGTDLGVLCRNICGVNLGIGYHFHHTPNETLVLEEWENTLEKVNGFLKQPQPQYRSKYLSPYFRFAKRCVLKLLRILKLKK